jgi:hypothetical protein
MIFLDFESVSIEATPSKMVPIRLACGQRALLAPRAIS